MIAKGKIFKYGSNVNTDVIIPARYLNMFLPEDLAEHCMEDLDDKFVEEVKKGDIIVAEENFGCGSSREHAPISIKASGVTCVIASSFARIFYRNCINIGLPIFECPEATVEASRSDIMSVDFQTGEVINETTGKTYQAAPFPPFIQEIIDLGGLMNYIKKGK